jgi:hypothetical protein
VDVHAIGVGVYLIFAIKAPAKRLRRWISLNCPRLSFLRLGDVCVSERIPFAFFNINNYGKENATWL